MWYLSSCIWPNGGQMTSALVAQFIGKGSVCGTYAFAGIHESTATY